MARTALAILVALLAIANALVALVLFRMAGSSPEQLASVAGRITGALIAGAVAAVLSYKLAQPGELRPLKAALWGLVVWLGASGVQLKTVVAARNARLADIYTARCRARCLESIKKESALSAEAGQRYCEGYCACMQGPALAVVERVSKGPDARKRLTTELPKEMATVQRSCEESAAAKAGLPPPGP